MVIAGALIWWKGWLWIDPVISLLIVAVIFIGTWNLLKDSMNYTLDSVPDKTDIPALRKLTRRRAHSRSTRLAVKHHRSGLNRAFGDERQYTERLPAPNPASPTRLVLDRTCHNSNRKRNRRSTLLVRASSLKCKSKFIQTLSYKDEEK
jgi:hypothetical protein